MLKLGPGCCVEVLKLLTSKYKIDGTNASLNTNFHPVTLLSQKTMEIQLVNLYDVL